ncbi:MAG: hypothetical protein KAW12_02085 [Candidatus Aminicenantes bacterium]|nr:hypothetical protein [Candidatus Aminicenantes bacterium]
MKKIILIFTLVFVTAAFLGADVYIKIKKHSDAVEIKGRKIPAQDEITEMWIGDNKLANISADQRIVIDLTKNVMYLIVPQSKTYIETGLPFDMANLLPEELTQGIAIPKAAVKVTPNGQTKQVGKWKCSGYDINVDLVMGGVNMKTEAWVTQDVPFDWKLYSRELYPHLMKVAMARMAIDENGINEYKKIAGFQVAAKTTSSFRGIKIYMTNEVQELSEKKAPAGTYTAPSDYKKVARLSMQ